MILSILSYTDGHIFQTTEAQQPSGLGIIRRKKDRRCVREQYMCTRSILAGGAERYSTLGDLSKSDIAAEYMLCKRQLLNSTYFLYSLEIGTQRCVRKYK